MSWVRKQGQQVDKTRPWDVAAAAASGPLVGASGVRVLPAAGVWPRCGQWGCACAARSGRVPARAASRHGLVASSDAWASAQASLWSAYGMITREPCQGAVALARVEGPGTARIREHNSRCIGEDTLISSHCAILAIDRAYVSDRDHIKQRGYVHVLAGPLPILVRGSLYATCCCSLWETPVCLENAEHPDELLLPLHPPLSLGTQPCLALCMVLSLSAEGLPTFSWPSHVRCTPARLARVGVAAPWRWTSGCAGLCGVTTPRRHHRARSGTSPGRA
jgi:hypothetical protein